MREITIYADVVWLLNFSVDMMLLLFTAAILKKHWKWYRLLLSAFIGSLLVLFMLSPYSYIATQPVVKIIFSFLMILVAFGFGRFRTFFQGVFMFYFATIVVGGGILGLNYFFQREITGNSFGNPISWLFLLLAFPVVFFFAKSRMEDVEIRKLNFNQLVAIEMKLGEKVQGVTGLIDSGNQLYDPLTKAPVMILDLDKVTDFIPQWLGEKTKDLPNFHLTKEEELSSLCSKIRIIPYRVVGQQNNFLLAIKPDYVKVFAEEGELLVTKVLIGLSHARLSSEGDYESILHPKMLQI